MDYEDELTATLLADAKCDVKKDPFRGAKWGSKVDEFARCLSGRARP